LTKSVGIVAAIIVIAALGGLGFTVFKRLHVAASPGPRPISAVHDQNAPSSVPPSHGMHTVSVAFDYNFKLTPACTPTVLVKCIHQFIVYDISAGADKSKRATLLSIALPANPNGIVTEISGTTPLMDFESGRHLIASIATEPDGTESPAPACASCTTWITIP
jgi:hypothetical protein